VLSLVGYVGAGLGAGVTERDAPSQAVRRRKPEGPSRPGAHGPGTFPLMRVGAPHGGGGGGGHGGGFGGGFGFGPYGLWGGYDYPSLDPFAETYRRLPDGRLVRVGEGDGSYDGGEPDPTPAATDVANLPIGLGGGGGAAAPWSQWGDVFAGGALDPILHGENPFTPGPNNLTVLPSELKWLFVAGLALVGLVVVGPELAVAVRAIAR
jgi:hypothetical protein